MKFKLSIFFPRLAGWGNGGSGGELQYANIEILTDTKQGEDTFYAESVEDAYHVRSNSSWNLSSQ